MKYEVTQQAVFGIPSHAKPEVRKYHCSEVNASIDVAMSDPPCILSGDATLVPAILRELGSIEIVAHGVPARHIGDVARMVAMVE